MRRFLSRLKPELRGSRKADEFSARELRFLAEQDGIPERALKLQWQPILAAHREIARAYLAQVSYDSLTDATVVLGLFSTAPINPGALAVPFHEAFRTDAHLDVVFLSAKQEAEMVKVCAPFYAGVLPRVCGHFRQGSY
jgi:hypothetical protein